MATRKSAYEIWEQIHFLERKMEEADRMQRMCCLLYIAALKWALQEELDYREKLFTMPEE